MKNALAIAVIFAVYALVRASSAHACGMYEPDFQPEQAEELLTQADDLVEDGQLAEAAGVYDRVVYSFGADAGERAVAAVSAARAYEALGETDLADERFDEAANFTVKWLQSKLGEFTQDVKVAIR